MMARKRVMMAEMSTNEQYCQFRPDYFVVFRLFSVCFRVFSSIPVCFRVILYTAGYVYSGLNGKTREASGKKRWMSSRQVTEMAPNRLPERGN